jgi:hypothetical protein
MTRLLIGLNKKSAQKIVVGTLLMIGLLEGCTHPFIDVSVKVDTCPPSTGTRVVSTGSPPEGVDGGCRSTMPLTTATDAFGALNAANSNQPITDHVHLCNAGTWMCQASPGSCFMGGQWKLCKTYFAPTTGNNGNCACNCPPA